MKIHWANNFDQRGNALGYTTHQKMLKKALEKNGVEFAEDADIAVSIITPPEFSPLPGKTNVLYTMYECTTLPPNWPKHINKADHIVVPCSHNKRLFKHYTKLPIDVCLEGCETDVYTYKKREFPKNVPFRFLWVGASNPRKGYEHVIVAWEDFKKLHPELNGKVELYMKTTQVAGGEKIVGYQKDGTPIKKMMDRDRVVKIDDVIIDTRRLPYTKEDENGDKWPTLNELYHSANAFVLPSMGEGFGLTLAEAMSTGLPCIYTPWSGPQDFISHKEGFPIKWHFVTVQTVTVMPDGSRKPRHKSQSASANIDSIVKEMYRIYTNYDYALEKGKKAAERIRREITWDISAKNFMKILNKIIKQRKVAA